MLPIVSFSMIGLLVAAHSGVLVGFLIMIAPFLLLRCVIVLVWLLHAISRAIDCAVPPLNRATNRAISAIAGAARAILLSVLRA